MGLRVHGMRGASVSGAERAGPRYRMGCRPTTSDAAPPQPSAGVRSRGTGTGTPAGTTGTSGSRTPPPPETPPARSYTPLRRARRCRPTGGLPSSPGGIDDRPSGEPALPQCRAPARTAEAFSPLPRRNMVLLTVFQVLILVSNYSAIATNIKWTPGAVRPSESDAHNAPRSQKYWDEHGK